MDRILDTRELGNVIRKRRRELGYTQAFLANYAGVSASFLSELENGKETSVAEVSGVKKAKDTIKKCIECYISDFQMA